MKPPTVFLGEMTNPEVEAFLRGPRHGHRADRLDRAARPARPAADRRAHPGRGRPPRRAAGRRAVVAPSINYGLSYPHVGFTGVVHLRIADVHGARRGLCAVGWRRWASGGSCSSTATTTTPTRSPTPARTRPSGCPTGARAFPINYWDGMTAEEAGEFFGPTAGLHANRAETSAVMAIDPALVDMDAGQRGDAAVPRGDQPGRRAHGVLLLDAGLGPSGDAIRDVGRRARVVGRVRRALPRGRHRGDAADARRRRADVRGDAAALRAGRAQPASRVEPGPGAHDPADARARRRARRGRRAGPAASRPRSVIPSSASGLRLAAATAAGSGDARRDEVADRRIEGDDRPGQRRGPDQRDPLTDDLDLEAADPAPAVAGPGDGDRVADEQQPVGRLEPGDERPERRVDVDPVGDELDVGARRRAARRGRRRARGGRCRSSR